MAPRVLILSLTPLVLFSQVYGTCLSFGCRGVFPIFCPFSFLSITAILSMNLNRPTRFHYYDSHYGDPRFYFQLT